MVPMATMAVMAAARTTALPLTVAVAEVVLELVVELAVGLVAVAVVATTWETWERHITIVVPSPPCPMRCSLSWRAPHVRQQLRAWWTGVGPQHCTTW